MLLSLHNLPSLGQKGQSPVKQNFDKFKGDPLLCVFSTITCYLERFGDKHQLLLSDIKPIKR